MAKSKPGPSLRTVARRYVGMWRSGNEEKMQHVLDQLGGYCGGGSEVPAEITYPEVAAVAALMMLDVRMTATPRKELAEALYQVTRNL